MTGDNKLRNEISKLGTFKLGGALSSGGIVKPMRFDDASRESWFYMPVESARIRQKYTCHATGATKVSFYHGSAVRVGGSLNKSAGPNKRLYHLRYPRLLISPRNPNVFFLTICTPPSSRGSCVLPRYPENKQGVRVYVFRKFANPIHSPWRVFISPRSIRGILIGDPRA